MDNPINHRYRIQSKREGFPKERIVRLTSTILDSCQHEALTKGVYPSSLGHFPEANDHLVERPEGLNNHLLIFCVFGKGFLKCHNQTLEINTHHMVIIPEGIPHSYGSHPNSQGWGKYWVHFKGELSQDFVDNIIPTSSEVLFHCSAPTALTQCFEELITLAELPQTTTNLFHLSMMLSYTLSKSCQLREPATSSKRDHQRMNDLLIKMKQDHAHPLSIEDLCQQANMTEPTFFRAFKRFTGCTPLQYLTKIRMQKACQFLDLSHDSITDIAHRVGYDDPYYFSRTFSKNMGESPRQYRKRNNGH
jgi:AraC-like DNA-binding protein